MTVEFNQLKPRSKYSAEINQKIIATKFYLESDPYINLNLFRFVHMLLALETRQ